MGKLQQQKSSRIWLEKGIFVCPGKNFYELFMYKIASIFAEEAESSENSNVSWGSSGEGATAKL